MVAAMWRGLGVFRPIALLYAAYSAYVRKDEMVRPWLAWLVLGVLAAWTVGSLLPRTRGRTSRGAGTELALACCAILGTGLVDTPEVIIGGAKTLPGLWPAAAVVAWAVLKGSRGGMLAALLVGVADIVEVGLAALGSVNSSATHSSSIIGSISSSTANNIVILVLLGGCVGYCADLARGGHTALRQALEVQAQARERDRLARTVHDGVLQTLSYVHRRGLDLGGEARELGLMAADQERQLRALVSEVPTVPALVASDQVDLRSVLGRYAGRSVTIVPPAEPVLVGASVADELVAAVGAALDNVRRHAGGQAQAWVLVEDKGNDVTVSIRDNGVGVPAGRLAEAAGDGRMGLASSIGGRIRDLGGTVTLDSRPGAGTCLELTVSKGGPR